jgi:hypothetical protein
MIGAVSFLAGLRPNPDWRKLPLFDCLPRSARVGDPGLIEPIGSGRNVKYIHKGSGPNVIMFTKAAMSNLSIIHRPLGVIHRFGTLPSKRNMSIQGVEPALISTHHPSDCLPYSSDNRQVKDQNRPIIDRRDSIIDRPTTTFRLLAAITAQVEAPVTAPVMAPVLAGRKA